jgi:hypothetical protein
MKELINEAFRFQRLAGIITENEYMEKNTSIYENSLKPQEKEVFDDIINTINEDGGFIDKIKSYAKKGLITISVIAALFAGSQLSQDQKDQVLDTIKTEMPTNKDVDYQTSAWQANNLYKQHKAEIDKLAQEDAAVESLVNDLKNFDKASPEEQVNIGKYQKAGIEKIQTITFNTYNSQK